MRILAGIAGGTLGGTVVGLAAYWLETAVLHLHL